MATRSGGQPPETARKTSGTAITFTVLAGIFLAMAGFFHVLLGIVGLVNDEFYVVTQKWVFKFDVTVWGWIHIIAGLVVLAAGLALFSGAIWARTVAVAVAVISIIANFLWLPYYPWWAILIIVFDLFVIWALTLHGRDANTSYRAMKAE